DGHGRHAPALRRDLQTAPATAPWRARAAEIDQPISRGRLASPVGHTSQPARSVTARCSSLRVPRSWSILTSNAGRHLFDARIRCSAYPTAYLTFQVRLGCELTV